MGKRKGREREEREKEEGEKGGERGMGIGVRERRQDGMFHRFQDPSSGQQPHFHQQKNQEHNTTSQHPNKQPLPASPFLRDEPASNIFRPAASVLSKSHFPKPLIVQVHHLNLTGDGLKKQRKITKKL